MRLNLSILVLSLCLPAVAAAQPLDPEKSAEKMITPPAQQGIDQGLKWLAGRQNEDGSFGVGAHRSNAAVCGLCGMSFLAAGSTPGRGHFGDSAQRAVDYLLSIAQPSGFICESPPTTQGPMYSHGFATLFLSESYGMSHRKELREKLKLAVKLIVDTQNSEGGWRYQPKIEEHADISVTVCQVMALRAAHNAGIYVPKKTFEQAVAYVKQSRNRDGGFMYMISAPGESAFPRSAAAIVALNSAGIYETTKGADSSIVAKGLDYLSQFRPKKDIVRRDESYFEYGHYYAVQAMWQAGGERWAKWYPAVRDDLLSRQGKDGSWFTAYGAEYATAMCLLVLQMPENQLPIFQR
jgi:hypothetical protein